MFHRNEVHGVAWMGLDGMGLEFSSQRDRSREGMGEKKREEKRRIEESGREK